MMKGKQEVIEMVDLDSESSISSVYTRRKLHNNKVSSPVIIGTFSTPSKTSNISEMFQAKSPQNINTKIPRKRLISNTSEHDASTSNDVSEITSLKQQFSFESKTDSKSYRDKIKERFHFIKKQAEKSASSIKSLKKTTERVVVLNKSIEIMRRENMQIENELQEHRKLHLDDISQVNMYNFFCETIEEHVGTVGNIDAVLGESREELISQKGDSIFVYSKPESLQFNIKVSEEENYCYLNSKPVEIQEKTTDGEPYFANIDGLYETVLPKIISSNINKTERRLLNSGESGWFRTDGKLDILESPLNHKTYHPQNFKSKPSFTEYFPAKKFALLQEDLLSVTIEKENILRIYISSIKFMHHPLFSVEHVFSQRLIMLYDQYREKIVSNRIEHISKHLDALRFVNKSMENTLGDAENVQELEKLTKRKMEIKSLREKLFDENKELRNITKDILKTWTVIKHIRNTNNYSNTNIKLAIHKEDRNYKEDITERKKQIALVFSEVLLEEQEKYKDDLNEYKEDLAEWKLSDDKLSRNKPRKPIFKISKGEIRQELEDKFDECFRPPGEPIITFTLSYDNTITDNVEKLQEKQRRNAVSTTKVHIKILCNQIEICKSKSIYLSESFTCLFDEALSVKLSKIPENITVELHEHPNKLLKRKIGEINLEIPQKKNKFSGLTEIQFKKIEIIHYKHEGVGSNINTSDLIKQYNLERRIKIDENLVTSGFVTYNLQWESLRNDKSSVFDNIQTESGGIEVFKLKDFTKAAVIDPENPQNAPIFDYIHEFESVDSKNKTENYFRLNPDLNNLTFCKAENVEENLRLKFLELRDRNEPEFVSLVVPNRLKEIPTNILSAYKKRLVYNENFNFEEEYEDNADERRSKGRRYLQQIHTKVFQKCRCLHDNLQYEDVVNEKLIMYLENSIKSIVYNVFNWLSFRPNTSQTLPRLMNKDDTKTDKVDISYSTQIKICVISAHNLPTKSLKKGANKTKQSMEEMLCKDSSIFVRIRNESVTLRTTSSTEAEPKWNEILVIPLQTASTDYLSPNALNGSITIDIFDEEMLKPTESLEDNYQTEHWLGFISIPIASICQYNRIEGQFRLNAPQVIFGYEQEFEKVQTNSPRFPTIPLTAPNIPFVHLKINIEPNIPKLHANMTELACNEPPYLKDHILMWNENYTRNFAVRKFSALVIDLNCKTTCITRYIRPLEPPQMNQDGFEVSPEECARYISLIPFSDFNKVYEAIWQPTNNLLRTMIGTVYDHAVALTNFLLALNMECWLLLGFGVPHGATAYVLIREYTRENEPSHFIFETTTAQKYNITDINLPLKQIFCIVNENNIWANVQRTDDMLNVRFDLSKRGDWWPLFDNKVSAPTNSIQHRIIYRTVEDVLDIEYKLEKKLRKRIMKLRKMQRTVWNHDITNRFKSTMPRFEMSVAHGKYSLDMFELRNVLNSLTINGFVLSTTYTTAKSICELIKNTNVHLIEDENTEFVLAVHLQPYANDVFAVWIVYAVIINR